MLLAGGGGLKYCFCSRLVGKMLFKSGSNHHLVVYIYIYSDQ